MKNLLQNKKVLFITTKNIDYIRNIQEMDIIKKQARAFEVLGFADKGYPKRLLKLYWCLLFKNVKSFDVIFIGFAPQLVLPLFGFKFRKKTVIIDFFISLYDTVCCDRRKFSENGMIGRLLKRLDKRTLRKSDLIIADTKSHGRYFAKELGADENKIEVLYLEADRSIYRPLSVEKKDDAKGRFVVLYFGSCLPLQGVDVVLGAAGLLKDRKDILFYIIGPVEGRYELPKSDNIKYIPWLAQRELAEYIATADLCLAGHFNNNIEKAKRTIPGKAYIYEAMEKPMILGDNEAVRERYDESMSGIYFVPMGDAGALAEKIENAYSVMVKKLQKH